MFFALATSPCAADENYFGSPINDWDSWYLQMRYEKRMEKLKNQFV